MFRNLVRSGLRLSPNGDTVPRSERTTNRTAATSPAAQIPVPVDSDSSISQIQIDEDDEGQVEVHSEDTSQKEKEVEVQDDSEPPEDESTLGLSDDEAVPPVVNVMEQATPSPRPLKTSGVPKTPVPTKAKPAVSAPRTNDDHLFKVPELPRQNSPKKNVASSDDAIDFANFGNASGLQSQGKILFKLLNSHLFFIFLGNDNFFNILGEGSGDNNDGALFSFLHGDQQTSTSGAGNFFSFDSSPQNDNGGGDNNFLF